MRKPITAGLMTMLLLPACGDRAMEPADVFGSWRVVSHTAGFVAALSDAEAAAWVGREAAYGPTRAVLHDAVCNEPTYTPGTWTPGAFSAHFQIRLSGLGIDSETITTVEVGCPGAWTVPGATLILAGDRMYTHWDGVFFELRRANPDGRLRHNGAERPLEDAAQAACGTSRGTSPGGPKEGRRASERTVRHIVQRARP